MTPPQTGFERTGDWTTLADEEALLDQIDAETAATVTPIGVSPFGRTMRQVSLGTPEVGTMFIVALQHGTEQAARDGALTHLRDMAYSTDPDVLHYLASHRIVWVPTANPDGFAAGTRLTGEGGNMNRDWFALEVPETRIVLAAIRAEEPDVIVDMHELISATSNYVWYARGNGLPSTHPDIQALGTDMQEETLAGMAARGHSVTVFPGSEYPRAGLSVAAGAYHAVGLLGETNITGHTMAERVAAQLETANLFVDWHRANGPAARTARTASITRDMLATTPDQLMLEHNFFTSTYTVETVAIQGYQLQEPLPQVYADAFDLTVVGGVVPMQQHYRQVIPHLMDPAAIERQVQATRVYWPDPPTPQAPLPDGVPVSALVMVDGRPRPVVGMYYQQAGRRIPASLT